MELNAPFRWVRKKDCPRIAELFSISSGGVADYVWSTLDRPGLSLLEIGAERYAREAEESVFSYRNGVVAELDGAAVGMLVSFPTEPEPSGPEPEDRARDPGGADAPAIPAGRTCWRPTASWRSRAATTSAPWPFWRTTGAGAIPRRWLLGGQASAIAPDTLGGQSQRAL